jgi:hypothetical protein
VAARSLKRAIPDVSHVGLCPTADVSLQRAMTQRDDFVTKAIGGFCEQ